MTRAYSFTQCQYLQSGESVTRMLIEILGIIEGTQSMLPTTL